MSQIGDVEQDGMELGIHLPQLLVLGFDGVRDRFHGGDRSGGVLARLFHPSDLFGGTVLFGPQVFDAPQDRLSLCGRFEEFAQVELQPAGGCLFHDEFRMFQDEFWVQHGSIIAHPRRPREGCVGEGSRSGIALRFGDPGDRINSPRRDGRVVEGGGLENRITSDRDGGSNPSPSATSPQVDRAPENM